MSGNNYTSSGRCPVKMCPNRVWRTYSGGKLLDEWKGISNPQDSQLPEEWIASAVSARNPGREHIMNEGLSEFATEAGEKLLLKSLVESSPEIFLGEKHVARYGGNTGVLVKALDSQERLTIQVHPDREAAGRIFRSEFGKTEAWYIIGGREVNGEQPYVLLGFKPGISRQKWEQLFQTQDIQTMMAMMHKFPVKPGQVYLIEGGVPHAIGPGCFLIEIQEPTDYTLRVERRTPSGHEVPEALCHQGAGFEKMFECFKYDGYTRRQIEERWCRKGEIFKSTPGAVERVLIGITDTPCFGMNSIEIEYDYSLQNIETFSILVVLDGSGELMWENGNMQIIRGDEIFLPAGVRNIFCTSAGKKLSLVRCFPPDS